MTLEQSLRDIMRAHNLCSINLTVADWHDQPAVDVFWKDETAGHGMRLVQARAETYASAISDAISKANAIRFPAIELPGDAVVLEGGVA